MVVGRAYGSVPASPPLWKVLGSIRFGSWAAARAQSLNLARRWSVPLASKHVYQLSTALALRSEVAGLLSRLLAQDDGSDKVGSVRQQAPRIVTMSKGYSLDKVAGRILLTLVDVAVWKSTTSAFLCTYFTRSILLAVVLDHPAVPTVHQNVQPVSKEQRFDPHLVLGFGGKRTAQEVADIA